MARLQDGDEGTEAPASPDTPNVPQGATRPIGRFLLSSGAAEALDILPDVAGRPAEQDPYPRVPASPPFRLVYCADRWDVLEGHLIPQLYRLSFNPGVNGVSRGSGGAPDPTDALAAVDRQGHYALPWDIGYEGKPGEPRSYLRGFQVGVAQDRKTGAFVKVISWHTRFEQLYAGSEHIQSDTIGYVTWLSGLVQRGLLGQPRPYVIERLVRHYETRLGKELSKANGSAESANLYRQRLGVVRAWQEDLRAEQMQTPVAPLEEIEPVVATPEPVEPPSSPRGKR